MWSAGSTDLFSNREITLLIELVEALPVLYAADKKSFKAIVPREKAWKIISDKLNRTGKSCYEDKLFETNQVYVYKLFRFCEPRLLHVSSVCCM